MSFGKNSTGWRYFFADEGEDSGGDIKRYRWQKDPHDHEDAAKAAWEQIWDSAGGDYGMGAGPDICIVSPSGEVETFSTRAEASVDYVVEKVE